MRALFWNIRGFGVMGRRTLLKAYLRTHCIDIVCLQETIKHDFTDQELRSLETGEKFIWCWLPATGHSGGMLLGFRDSAFEVGLIGTGRYYIMASVICRSDRARLDVIGIYGPADHTLSAGFLEEISNKVAAADAQLIVGGDFNLLRAAHDKNNDRINWARLDLFNDHIANWGLREIPRMGARYTWTNKQLNPVRCVLDSVFMSLELEPRFPLCSLVAETSLGSDHTPLIFDSGEGAPPRSNRFFFESGWLEVEEFPATMHQFWSALTQRVGGWDIVDWWNFMSSGLRQNLHGWSSNMGKEAKAQKHVLLSQIQELDDRADNVGIEPVPVSFRRIVAGSVSPRRRILETERQGSVVNSW
jgi:exonuclease III